MAVHRYPRHIRQRAVDQVAYLRAKNPKWSKNHAYRHTSEDMGVPWKTIMVWVRDTDALGLSRADPSKFMPEFVRGKRYNAYVRDEKGGTNRTFKEDTRKGLRFVTRTEGRASMWLFEFPQSSKESFTWQQLQDFIWEVA